MAQLRHPAIVPVYEVGRSDTFPFIAAEFVEGPFSEASVSAKLEAWRTQIADAIEEDPLVDSAAWQSAVDDLLADLPKLQDNLTLMMSGLITE